MKRSKFNLSHTQLHTCRMGDLIPVGITEVLPGDTFQHAAQALVRAAPLATPPMHPVRLDVRHFFVPTRLVWDSFEDFITGGPDGMNESVFPTMSGSYGIGSLLDHLGVPPGTAPFSALPVRAVNLIWNEFYRDQDLQDPRIVSKADGADVTTDTSKLYQCWEKDYFTTSRPNEQKGPAVTLPLGTSAPVTIDTIRNITVDDDGTPLILVRGENGGGGLEEYAAGAQRATDVWEPGQAAEYLGQVDLTAATSATVNDLRLALAVQRYQEARSRFGSRYTEYLRYLGVRSSDARLQRPEYLGGSRSPLQFSEMMSTNVIPAADEEENPVLPGVFGGHGIGANRTNRYRKFFEEHGFVITLFGCLPQTMYPNGLFRMWNRRTKEDFWQKELQHIGQQAVLNKELNRAHNTPDAVFGYQDRYDEYRRSESQVHGYFRAGSYLQDWHFARNLSDTVALNEDFVRADPTDLPFQVREIGEAEADTLYLAVRHQLVARRMLSSRGSSFIL